MPFTSKLAEIMAAKNISYDDLQFAADITRQTVARARDERIAGCTLTTLEKIAEALEVDVHSLFTYTASK